MKIQLTIFLQAVVNAKDKLADYYKNYSKLSDADNEVIRKERIIKK